MPDIHIHREHQLGLKEARKIAFSWAEKAEEKFDMECVYEEGDTEDTLTFSRSGVKGTLLVDATQFEMKAQLGFLFGAFKDRIESEIGDQLDALLNGKPAKAAGKKAAADAEEPKKDKAPAKAAPKAAPKAAAKTPAKTAAKPKKA
ncbi:polyhydroxyalkanoic acid synthase [Acidovorax sp. Leaf76]|uniref:polyhydroxyalkanoic acid system family protein n=1 Tax=unclassified Acidovorax TaxID=2684926 RepID=UPI0006F844F9|nr:MULTISPECIES: polyhydroxyalkanoic acid system family protein [unclassified Acidovorax]KQO26229.1 polyhydroxyalkanoic acid synthase [Acidovorax sp. Leaf76]KQO35827.1 polyhydroxyalkanoic acid synthase [Acidovorax sp. Leaf84]KQS38248.1 polyhydroxyalkanoic acid synthase [Acidovorax sp. Leaf191]